MSAVIETLTLEPPLVAIKSRLHKARQIWRVSETLARILIWFGGLLTTLLLLALLDNVLDLPGFLRLILGIGTLLAVLAGLALWALRPLFWKINDQAAAVYLERKLGERENLLINAIQLGTRAPDDGLSDSTEMIEQVISRAASRALELSIDLVWDKKRLKKLGAAAVLVSALMLIYVLAMPAYASNAFQRYSRPLSGLPPISNVRVLAFPSGEIEVLAGDSLTVQALGCVRKGDLPAEAYIMATLDGSRRRLPMEPVGSVSPELAPSVEAGEQTVAFSYEMPQVSKSFSFYVSAGDGRSSPCNVTVRERPGIEELHLELTPPAYTLPHSPDGKPIFAPVRQPLPSALVYALSGSRATLTFDATRDLASGALELADGRVAIAQRSGKTWEGSFIVQKEGTFTLSLKASDGVETKNALEGRVLPQADALPAISFDTSSLNISATPGSKIPLAVKAQDDFGLRYVRLLVRKQLPGGEGGEEKDEDFTAIKEWHYPLPGSKHCNELFPLELDPAKYNVGGTYSFQAEASDYCPNGKRTVRSAPLVIHVLTPEQMAPGGGSPLEQIFKRIQELINLQNKARAKTISVREFMDEILQKNLVDKRLDSVAAEQNGVNGTAQRLIGELDKQRNDKGKERVGEILVELKSIHAGPMREAARSAAELSQSKKERIAFTSALQQEEQIQTEIIARLTALLGTLSTIDKERKHPDTSDLVNDDQENTRLRDKLEDAKEKIEDFIQVQKKVIKSTEELEKKKPNDLSEEDEKKLGDLAKEEQDWAKYFREAFTDLSKVPDQDFSNSKLAKEFNEVYQEIQKAAEALAAKNIEIAVRNEEAGLELAKNLETNLEKWLPDTRDNIKWNMEEPQGQFDVPLSDLPEELEDIIGELIDAEEDMTEDVEDTSSSWMDSLDKGAGWDAMDGNISNMSAKGVTGNRLPNQQEIGGRSGEGRTGKSHGQFVEETADGKGGRQTPSRTTNDPYEAGQVDDKSTDPIGGATGGGKMAGGATGGLRGQPPPAAAQKMDRLKETQAQLRQEAEKVVTKLQAYHLPSSDMEEAVRRMKSIETHLENKTGFNLRQAHSQVIDTLKKEKSVMEFQAKINREQSRDLPANVRHNIMSGMGQKVPQGYQDLLEAYYRSLVEKEK